MTAFKDVSLAPAASLYDHWATVLQMQVRVWWPPTEDEDRTGYSGAYWPAHIISRSGNKYEVRYDNGDVEEELEKNIFPYEAPVSFGQETSPLNVSDLVIW